MNKSGANRDFYSGNRKKLAGKIGKNALAVINSNDLMPRNGDQYFPYRQNSDLYYFTGIEQEETLLVMAPGFTEQKKREILFIKKADQKTEIWEGKKLSREEARDISGVEQVMWTEEFDPAFRELILSCNEVYFNLNEYPKLNDQMKLRRHRFVDRIREQYPLHQYRRLSPLIRDLRVVKQEPEIEMIRESCAVTEAGFERVLAMLAPGVNEYEVEAELTYAFRKKGAGHAFLPVIASGNNACYLHYTKNKGVCREGEFLLMDFGAECANYAADVSRTLPVNGKFTGRQLELYQSTLRVLKKAIALFTPGTTIAEIHEKVCRYWEEEHVRLGLYSEKDLKNQDPEAPLYKKYFMHGTSHFLGLDVHDAGDKHTTLCEGMVLTCEPGIYLPDEQTGIRLEEDVMVSRDGPVNLTENIPIEPGDIQKLMNRNK